MKIASATTTLMAIAAAATTSNAAETATIQTHALGNVTILDSKLDGNSLHMACINAGYTPPKRQLEGDQNSFQLNNGLRVEHIIEKAHGQTVLLSRFMPSSAERLKKYCHIGGSCSCNRLFTLAINPRKSKDPNRYKIHIIGSCQTVVDPSLLSKGKRALFHIVKMAKTALLNAIFFQKRRRFGRGQISSDRRIVGHRNDIFWSRLESFSNSFQAFQAPLRRSFQLLYSCRLQSIF